MPLELKWVENVQSLVAGLHKGRAAARIFVCSQQKPWTEQVESFSCIFKNFIRICIFSHPVNFGVWKEWQFLQHFHGQVRLLVVIPTSFFAQKKGEMICAKKRYFLKEFLCKYWMAWTGDFWWWDPGTATTSSSSSTPVNQHHEGFLRSFTSL